MIDVSSAIEGVPCFDKFCSVAELDALSRSLSAEQGFAVKVAGLSAQGRPIHHVRFGAGATKALLVGFPHPNEPIGGLTITSLLTLLRDRHPAFARADVEWHIVPCIDPDGALLNESWTQRPFSLESYMRGFHRQELRDQVECSFPIAYKRMRFDSPTVEAQVLQSVLDVTKPDFYFSLHNAFIGGAHFLTTADLGQAAYDELFALLRAHDISLGGLTRQEGRITSGVFEMPSMQGWYDRLEAAGAAPETMLVNGGSSWEYLRSISPGALTFVMEMPCLRHPSDGSIKHAPGNLRRLKLKLDADSKYLITLILETWESVAEDLPTDSPLYTKTFNGVISQKDTLIEGLPAWVSKTREILFSSAFSAPITEGARFVTYHHDGFYALCNAYEFIRLLEVAPRTEAVAAAIARLKPRFDEVYQELAAGMEADKFELIDWTTLARIQLGAGLVALNTKLAA
jgi:hypothetical protein